MHLVAWFPLTTLLHSLFDLRINMAIVTVIFQLSKPYQILVAFDAIPLKVPGVGVHHPDRKSF
ncbi:hypothetical protein D3C87_1841140 [compost metagenome]